ncbi:hypothetical protein [Paracoccus sp. (in: a-proteobacteria)]|uniref:DUF7210 family protein n=1 Tax=Paracoccus sp. TaxID=267 RepID=UPI003220091F
MGNRISVQLTGPAKIGGKWCKPGDHVEVAPEIARELATAGAVAKGVENVFAEVAPGDLASGMPGFDEAVAEQAKLLADAAVAAAVENAMTELTADRDAARTRAADAEAEVSRQYSQIMALEAEIAELKTALAELAPATTQDGAGEGSAAASAPKSARKRASEAKG